MATIKIYTTDTYFGLAGELKARWDALTERASDDDRRPMGYAIWLKQLAIERAAQALAAAQGVTMIGYVGWAVEDDGTMMGLLAEAEELLAKLQATLAAQQPVTTYPCKGAQDGCPAQVTVRGSYCASCAHDE